MNVLQLRRFGACLPSRLDITCVCILLLASWGLRTLFQSASETESPWRADAGWYLAAAFNLRIHGVHSIDQPNFQSPPRTRSDLSPGYPLFLTLLLDPQLELSEFIARVQSVQAVLGALTVFLTYVLARMALSVPWAFLAACLTSISPHLIISDHYMLTESLFTCVLMAGVVLCTIGWVRNRPLAVILGSLAISMSAQIRAVSYLLAPFLIFAFLVRLRAENAPPFWRQFRRQAGAVVTGCIIVLAAHQLFIYKTSMVVTDGKLTGPERRHVNVASRARSVFKAIRPPEFFVSGDSHVGRVNGSPTWRRPTRVPFSEAPLAYLNWNLWGRLTWMWHFDNIYNGDVYVYPMISSGFNDIRVLKWIHSLMRIAHWPLYALSLIGAVRIGIAILRRQDVGREQGLVIAVAVFLYFLLVLSALSWYPRYTIPVRPVSYVLAASSLSWLWHHARSASSRLRIPA